MYYSWLLECLHLAQVPPIWISAIESLTRTWTTILTFRNENKTIISHAVNVSNGIFQGVIRSVFFVVLASNLLSFLKRQSNGDIQEPAAVGSFNVTHESVVDYFRIHTMIVYRTKTKKNPLELPTGFPFPSDTGNGIWSIEMFTFDCLMGKITLDWSKTCVSMAPLLIHKKDYNYVNIVDKERMTRIFSYQTSKKCMATRILLRVHDNIPRHIWLFLSLGCFTGLQKKSTPLTVKSEKYCHQLETSKEIDISTDFSSEEIKQFETEIKCRILSIRQHLLNNKSKHKYINVVQKNEENSILLVCCKFSVISHIIK